MEDENIIGTLIDFVREHGDEFYGSLAKSYAIDWLEKQRLACSYNNKKVER